MKGAGRLSAADFKTLRPERRLSSPFFSLSVAASGSGLRWACVVSKKAAAHAVDRNRIKRRARAILRGTLRTAGDPPVALVFHAKRAAAEAGFPELKKDLEGLIARARRVGAL